MTYQEAARTALGVQDAINLSGVVTSFQGAIMAVWDEALRTGKGTQWVNQHPITVLFVDKLQDLNRFVLQDVLNSYKEVQDIERGAYVSKAKG